MSKRIKYILTYFACVVALLLVRIGFRENFFGNLTDLGSETLFSTLVQVFCMGIIPLICVGACAEKGEGFRPLRDRFYLKPLKDGKIWLVAIVVALLHLVINSGVSTVWGMIVRSTGYTPVVSDPDAIYTVGGLLLSLLLHAVFPAFFEEITHRGLCMSATRGADHKRVWFTALLFALMHQNIMQTGYTFVCGLVMGYLVVYTGSIIPAMITHFINNALVQLRVFSYSTGGILAKFYDGIYALSNSWWGFLILTLVWVLGVVGAFFGLKYLKNKRDESGDKLDSVVVKKSENEAKLAKVLWIAVIVVGTLATLYSYVAGLIR